MCDLYSATAAPEKKRMKPKQWIGKVQNINLVFLYMRGLTVLWS